MRATSRSSAVLMTLVVSGALGAAPAAHAEGNPINGTYVATSVGEWAKTNETFQDEPTVRSKWTISSSCQTYQECTGLVTSDQGWSAPLNMHDGSLWYVRRDVANWRICDDGTAFTGKQTFTFTPVGADGMVLTGSPTLEGQDKTVGPSGACGINRWYVINMPFRLDKMA